MGFNNNFATGLYNTSRFTSRRGKTSYNQFEGAQNKKASATPDFLRRSQQFSGGETLGPDNLARQGYFTDPARRQSGGETVNRSVNGSVGKARLTDRIAPQENQGQGGASSRTSGGSSSQTRDRVYRKPGLGPEQPRIQPEPQPPGGDRRWTPPRTPEPTPLPTPTPTPSPPEESPGEYWPIGGEAPGWGDPNFGQTWSWGEEGDETIPQDAPYGSRYVPQELQGALTDNRVGVGDNFYWRGQQYTLESTGGMEASIYMRPTRQPQPEPQPEPFPPPRIQPEPQPPYRFYPNATWAQGQKPRMSFDV